MTKFKLIMKFSDEIIEERDEIFYTEEEAEEWGVYLCDCSPLDENDFEVVEFDD